MRGFHAFCKGDPILRLLFIQHNFLRLIFGEHKELINNYGVTVICVLHLILSVINSSVVEVRQGK